MRCFDLCALNHFNLRAFLRKLIHQLMVFVWFFLEVMWQFYGDGGDSAMQHVWKQLSACIKALNSLGESKTQTFFLLTRITWRLFFYQLGWRKTCIVARLNLFIARREALQRISREFRQVPLFPVRSNLNSFGDSSLRLVLMQEAKSGPTQFVTLSLH